MSSVTLISTLTFGPLARNLASHSVFSLPASYARYRIRNDATTMGHVRTANASAFSMRLFPWSCLVLSCPGCVLEIAFFSFRSSRKTAFGSNLSKSQIHRRGAGRRAWIWRKLFSSSASFPSLSFATFRSFQSRCEPSSRRRLDPIRRHIQAHRQTHMPTTFYNCFMLFVAPERAAHTCSFV